VFKWGLAKKDFADLDVPDELKGQMKSIVSKFDASDPVVLVLDRLSQIIQKQQLGIEQSNSKAYELKKKLEQANRAKNFQADLLTSMCDEIQAPIHTLNQVGDWLNQTHLDPNQKAGFDIYRITGRKLNDLFKNIIDVAKLREGVFQLDPISFQLKELVGDILQALNLTAQEKGISLHINIDPDVPQYVVGDMRRLEQVMISLINNAIKFTYEGEVRVSIQKGRDNGRECAINFLVMDSGMGIPETQLDTIFDRLAQGDPDVERNYGGTGLGLFICKCLVEQMGGAIWAENRKEGGATFGFGILFEKGSLEEVEDELLLLSKRAEAEDFNLDEELQESEVPGKEVVVDNNGKGENLKILVVDDCKDTCKLIERFLEKGHYDVDIVNDGQAALEKHSTGDYDLILMDIQLPGLDGISATIEIRHREIKKASKTPIYALVGSSSQADGEYLAADFDQCLIKPVSKRKLLEAVDSLKIPRKKIAK
jgi:signal transduction histidine kinase/BarA-like signal transduction histidine kinase